MFLLHMSAEQAQSSKACTNTETGTEQTTELFWASVQTTQMEAGEMLSTLPTEKLKRPYESKLKEQN